MPSTPEELQAIISVEKRPFKEEDLKEIVDLLNSYRAKSG